MTATRRALTRALLDGIAACPVCRRPACPRRRADGHGQRHDFMRPEGFLAGPEGVPKDAVGCRRPLILLDAWNSAARRPRLQRPVTTASPSLSRRSTRRWRGCFLARRTRSGNAGYLGRGRRHQDARDRRGDARRRNSRGRRAGRNRVLLAVPSNAAVRARRGALTSTRFLMRTSRGPASLSPPCASWFRPRIRGYQSRAWIPSPSS